MTLLDDLGHNLTLGDKLTAKNCPNTNMGWDAVVVTGHEAMNLGRQLIYSPD